MKLLSTLTIVMMFLFSTLLSNGQEVVQPVSRYQSLAESSVALSDCWSVFGNQAGLAAVNHMEIGGSFQNRFLLKELSTRAGVFVFPVQSSVFALSLYQFGEVPFRQEKFGIAYSRYLFPRLRFGFQFNYYRLFLSEDNRSVGSSGFEIGMQYLAAPKLVWGIHITNPYQTGIKTHFENYDYPSIIKWGAMFQVSPEFWMTSEVENDLDGHLIVRSGLEYAVLNKLFLRTGISGKPYQLTGGVGFQVKKLNVNMAVSYNQHLGNSPSVSIQYRVR